MALLMFDGMGDGYYALSQYFSSVYNVTLNQTGGRHNSGYICGSVSGSGVFKTIPGRDCHIMGIAFKAGTGNWPSITFYNSSSQQNAIITMQQAASSVTVVVANANSTTVLSSAQTLTAGLWGFIELKVEYSNTGAWECRFNGTSIGSGTSDFLAAAATQTTTLKFLMDYASSGFDDFYLLDTTGDAPYNTNLGDVRVRAVKPVSDIEADFTKSGLASNAACVAESPPSATNYVQHNTFGDIDIYQHEAVAPDGVIYAVQHKIVATQIDGSLSDLTPLIRIGSTDYDSSPLVVPVGSYSALENILTENPATSSAWVKADVSQIKAGYEAVEHV